MTIMLPPTAYNDPEVLRLRDAIARETLQTYIKSTGLFPHITAGGNSPPAPRPAEIADLCYGMAEAMVARKFGGVPEVALAPAPEPIGGLRFSHLGLGVRFRFPFDKRIYFIVDIGKYKLAGVANATVMPQSNMQEPVILVGDE